MTTNPTYTCRKCGKKLPEAKYRRYTNINGRNMRSKTCIDCRRQRNEASRSSTAALPPPTPPEILKPEYWQFIKEQQNEHSPHE